MTDTTLKSSLIKLLYPNGIKHPQQAESYYLLEQIRARLFPNIDPVDLDEYHECGEDTCVCKLDGGGQ